jgi:hypothetical protein
METSLLRSLVFFRGKGKVTKIPKGNGIGIAVIRVIRSQFRRNAVSEGNSTTWKFRLNGQVILP